MEDAGAVAELRRIRQYLERAALTVLLALGAVAGWYVGS
jgi:hypothetical protein